MADGNNFLALRKNRPLLLRVSFVLIMAGFVLGYLGGVNGSGFLIAVAFLLWGGAGAASLLIKS